MMRVASVVATVITAVSLSGCGGGASTAGGSTVASDVSVDPNTAETNAVGDIPDNQAYVAYTDAAGRPRAVPVLSHRW